MHSKFLKIEQNIWESFERENRIGLLTGLSGMALYYSKMHTAFQYDSYIYKLSKVIEKVNAILEKEACLSSLCSGIAGFGIVLLEIDDNYIKVDKEYYETLDSILIEDLIKFSELNNYDFLHGSMGIAMYFIERCKADKNLRNIEELNKFSENLIYKINNNLVDFFTSELTLDPKDRFCIYFGIAHGVSGCLNFLVHLRNSFSELKTDIKNSLQNCIAFLESYKKFDETSKQFYPNLILLKSQTVVNSRLSWCQGDLGVSNSLYNCGVYLNDENLINESRKLIATSQKITLEESFVKDFGLCHGSTGIALQYFMASQKYNMDLSKEIKYWTNIIADQTENFEKFKFYSEQKYIDESNLLEGTIGLGLTLLTLENKINTDWMKIINLF